jgi:hypothetical protein
MYVCIQGTHVRTYTHTYTQTHKTYIYILPNTCTQLIRTTRGGHNAAPPHHWCGLHKLPVKVNIQVLHTHTRLIVNGVVEDFLKNGPSQPSETNLLQLDDQKYEL